jgi:uncharacterized DUF497 family protein
MEDMDFTWREPKRQRNLRKHGLDFADAPLVFDDPTMTVEDARNYDGERRFNTTGFCRTAIVTICHTETDDEIYVISFPCISMRKAETHEIEEFSRYF